MRASTPQFMADWLQFLMIIAGPVLVFAIAGCWSSQGADNKGQQKDKAKAQLTCSLIRPHGLVGISEQVGCLLEATFPSGGAWNDPPREITVTAYSLNNQVALWNVRLVGKWLFSWSSSVSTDGSYIAAKLITHKGPLLEDPYYAQVVFFDLKQGKIAWMWPEKPVPLPDPRDRPSNFSAVYFVTDREAFWSTRKDGKAVVYKLNIPERKAEEFLTEGEAAVKFTEGPFYLGGYSRATRELLIPSGKVLYAITVGPERAWRVLLDDRPVGELHVSSNGTTIALLGEGVLTLLHGPPDFKVHCRLDASKLPGLASPWHTVACSPNGQYIALSYFHTFMTPGRLIVLNLAGRPLLESSVGSLGEFCAPIIWFAGGRKIAAAVGCASWGVCDVQGLEEP